MQRALSRVLGFAPMVFWGRWGTPIPKRVPDHVVVGAPIAVTQNKEPTPSEVADMLTTFIAAMERLFEEHKAKAGYPHSKLVVL